MKNINLFDSYFLSSSDCFDFVKKFYKKKFNFDFKIDYVNVEKYKSIVHVIQNEKENVECWQKIDVPEDNCIVLLSKNNKMHHVGIWLDNGCYHFLNSIGLLYNDIQRLKMNGYKKMEFYRCQKIY